MLNWRVQLWKREQGFHRNRLRWTKRSRAEKGWTRDSAAVLTWCLVTFTWAGPQHKHTWCRWWWKFAWQNISFSCLVIASSAQSESKSLILYKVNLQCKFDTASKLAFTRYCTGLKEAADWQRAGQRVEPNVYWCTEPADWSLDSCHHLQKRWFALSGKQKEHFISQHVSEFLQQSLCVCFLERWVLVSMCFGYRFKLSIFSSVT